MDEGKFKKMNRRELLKLAPVVALAQFAYRSCERPLSKAGSVWVTGLRASSPPLDIWHYFADSDSRPSKNFPSMATTWTIPA